MEGTSTKKTLAHIVYVSNRQNVVRLHCQTRSGNKTFEFKGGMLSPEHRFWQHLLGRHVELHYYEEPDPDYPDVTQAVITSVITEPSPNRSVQSGILRCNWDYPGQHQLFPDDEQLLSVCVEPCFISGYQGIRGLESCQVRVGFEADEWGVDVESVTILAR